LIIAHQGLANLLLPHGDPDRAISEFQAAVTEAHQLMPVEPANKYWKSIAAGAQLDLAKALLTQGQAAEAAEQAQGGCALVAEIRGRNPVTPKLTACLRMRARLALEARDYARAQQFAAQAVNSARSDWNEDPAATQFGTAATYRLLGDVRQSSGDARGAKEAWSKALASVPKGIAERPQETDEHARILERLGRASEAQPLVSKLKTMGFRRLS
jgi:tetratricopeptide (TPR) repeat protein